jgi:hypothetical protein
MNSKQVAQALSTHPLTSHSPTSHAPDDPNIARYRFVYEPRRGCWAQVERFDPLVTHPVAETVVRTAVTQALAASDHAFNGATIGLALDMLKAGVR